ncbi:hypothetical protein DL768_010892 [Monosporascus sp. mg162]|nr:hypothetical protein DL768_010892 [Monosporascus sp. mg162]
MADLLISLPGMLDDIASIISWCNEYHLKVRGTAGFTNRIIDLLGAWVLQLELLEDLIKPDGKSSQSLRTLLANRILEQTRSCLREHKELVAPGSDGSPSRSDFSGLRPGIESPKFLDKLTWPVLKQESFIRRSILSHQLHARRRDLRLDGQIRYLEAWVEGGFKSQHGHRRFLWIHGIPGAGKAIIASFLIHTIANNCQSKGYSYYYCSHQRCQDETRPFLQWVFTDLCNQSERLIPQGLLNLYRKHRGSVHSVLIDDLLKCPLAVTRLFSRQVCIVVDAVDESSKPRNHFLKVLTTIGTNPDFDRVSLLLISLDELDIRAAVEALPPLGEIISFLESGLVLIPTGSDSAEPHTPPRGSPQVRSGEASSPWRLSGNLVPEFAKRYRAYTELSMDNLFVLSAISTSRWVTCQIDMIDSLELSDGPAIQRLLQNLPDTVFGTSERLIVERIPRADGRNEHNAPTSWWKHPLFNVPCGLAHAFDIQRLEQILGCLIKVTKLNQRPASVFAREDDANYRVHVAPAHYTVKEYIFAPDTAKGPAKDFALTNAKT